MLILVGACAKEIDDGGSSDVDFGSPKKVVASIFYAAKTGNAAHLVTLCDPQGASHDGAKAICAVSRDAENWASFARNFAAGRIIGEPRISGDRALVNVAYGVDGSSTETFELLRRGQSWFLYDF